MKRKIIYFFSLVIFIFVTFFSYKIISGEYDKQNKYIILVKEAVPNRLKSQLRNFIYELRRYLIEDNVQKIQKAKIDQGLNGDLIESKKIFTELDKKIHVQKIFLPFDRLDLNYGWKSIKNAKRAHYLDTKDDKTIVVSGKGEFIFLKQKIFFLKG